MKPTRTNRSIKKYRQNLPSPRRRAIPNRLASGSAHGQNVQNEPNLNQRLLTIDYRLTTINMQNKETVA